MRVEQIKQIAAFLDLEALPDGCDSCQAEVRVVDGGITQGSIRRQVDGLVDLTGSQTRKRVCRGNGEPCFVLVIDRGLKLVRQSVGDVRSHNEFGVLIECAIPVDVQVRVVEVASSLHSVVLLYRETNERRPAPDQTAG